MTIPIRERKRRDSRDGTCGCGVDHVSIEIDKERDAIMK